MSCRRAGEPVALRIFSGASGIVMAPSTPSSRGSNEAARIAAAVARNAKREEPDTFGHPELFIVSAGAHSFTWELRRFGGVVLQRGPEAFASAALARADGEVALAVLRAVPEQPTFERSTRP